MIETTETIRIAWDNRHTPRDRRHLRTLLVLGSVLAACGTIPVCLTFSQAQGGTGLEKVIGVVIAVFWWFFVAVVGYDLLGRRWAEWVEVSATSITVGRRGFLALSPTIIPVRPGMELFFGIYEDAYDRAPRPALEIVGPSAWGGRTRTEFGRWLTEPAQEQVFQTLAAFVATHNVPIAVTRAP